MMDLMTSWAAVGGVAALICVWAITGLVGAVLVWCSNRNNR